MVGKVAALLAGEVLQMQGKIGCGGTLAILFFIGLIFGGSQTMRSGDWSREVTEAEYGADWPFMGPSATLICRHKVFNGVRRPLVLVEIAGKEYGLNGAAMGKGGYPDARQFFKRTETGVYLGRSDLLIKEALENC